MSEHGIKSLQRVRISPGKLYSYRTLHSQITLMVYSVSIVAKHGKLPIGQKTRQSAGLHSRKLTGGHRGRLSDEPQIL